MGLVGNLEGLPPCTVPFAVQAFQHPSRYTYAIMSYNDDIMYLEFDLIKIICACTKRAISRIVGASFNGRD